MGQEFALATRQQQWGEERAVYFDGNGNMRSMAISWTDLAVQDLFQATASGSSCFRFDDLLALAERLSELSEAHRDRQKDVK